MNMQWQLMRGVLGLVMLAGVAGWAATHHVAGAAADQQAHGWTAAQRVALVQPVTVSWQTPEISIKTHRQALVLNTDVPPTRR